MPVRLSLDDLANLDRAAKSPVRALTCPSEGWIGTFRQTEKDIGINPLYIGVRFRSLVDDARYWAENGTYRPLEAGASFHHRLVQIHPFPNGNGRHSRIPVDEYLKHHIGHEPIDWEAGYDLVHGNGRRDEYLKALREADRGDYTRLLAFVGADQ